MYSCSLPECSAVEGDFSPFLTVEHLRQNSAAKIYELSFLVVDSFKIVQGCVRNVTCNQCFIQSFVLWVVDCQVGGQCSEGLCTVLAVNDQVVPSDMRWVNSPVKYGVDKTLIYYCVSFLRF